MATAGGARGAGPERAYARPLPAEGSVALDPDESRHLVRVRRAKAGDPVVLFDGLGGPGGTRAGVLEVADPRAAVVRVTGPAPDREPAVRVEVGCALPGAGRADALVQSLAEVGVDLLRPLRCERSERDADALVSARGARFERIAREAAKVNGRSRLLRVADPASPEAALRASTARPAVVLDPDPSLPPLSRALGDARAALLLVGPEGGFTEGEVERLGRLGCARASLGPCVLRVETAALAAAAVALVR